MGLGQILSGTPTSSGYRPDPKGRRSHPSLQNLGQDPLALRVVSLLSDDVSMLPSPSDFETLLAALTQRPCEFEKESMLRGLPLWRTTKVYRTQHYIENTVRQGETFFSDPIHIIDDEMEVWNELWQRPR